jgi:NADH-quinone oxidoreductase subunit J
VNTSSFAHVANLQPPTPQTSTLGMLQIGQALMQHYVLPLEVIGLMLTAAMIGAVILALRDKRIAAEPKDSELRAS